MGKIVLLDELTINKISAGEVIDRPASCVKEMCENSIDAGAKNITVEIKNGGISLIKIIDDGCGISEDDMEIAFERHATSKIRSAEDLEKVKTMGFRGEALASISAISKVEMISKRLKDEFGHKIIVEGGKVIEKSECGASNGTSITVKNLFYNTPVRYKFLKKDFTESGYIEDVITRLALVNKNVSFKLINTGKTVIQTVGNNDLKTIVYSIYGKDTADGVFEVDYTYEDIRITGVIGNSNISRSNRNGQNFFVNNRYVKDKILSQAVDQAYKDLLPVGKYGFVILNIEMDTSKVDCNIHPAKLEVRFEEEQKVFKAIYHAIKSKNDEIINKKNKFEIKEKEIVNDTQDIDNAEEENEENFKPRKGTFSGFFKMFKNESEDKEEEKENTIRDIFESRKNEIAVLNEDLKDEEKIEAPEKIEKAEEIEKNEETENLEIEEKVEIEPDVKEAKLGNTIISSDTKPSNFNINDVLKSSETMKFDAKEIFSANSSKTEVMDSIKKIELENNKETAIINTEEVRNYENQEEDVDKNVDILKDINNLNAEKNTITEKILTEKIKNDMEDTQFVDTAKVREELRKEETPVTKDFANMYKKVFGMDVSTIRKTKEAENAKLDFSNNIQIAEGIVNETIFEKEEKSKINYKFIGTIFNDFAIIEIKDEMYMIEKNSAEERLMYEIVKNNFYDEENNNSVTLLLADIVTLNSKEMNMARDLKEMFLKAGFEYEEFGDCTLKLIKVPNWAEKLNTKQLFLEILKEMNTVAVTDLKRKEEKFIGVISSKYVLFLDSSLNEDEFKQLVDKLLKLDKPFVYPSGKLTAVKITKANMEKKFSRR